MKEENNNKKIFGVPSLDNALKEGKTEINVSSKGVLLKEDNSFFLNLLIDTYNNEAEMKLIKNSNDYMNQAPVLTWLLLKYKEIRENNMDKILKLLRIYNDKEIILISLYPSAKLSKEKITEINEKLKIICSKYNIKYIDIENIIETKDYFFNEKSYYLNYKGHRMISEKIIEKINN